MAIFPLHCPLLRGILPQDTATTAEQQVRNSKEQKACYVELSHIQQTQHAQMSQQIQEFIGSQQQQLEVTGCRLNRTEHKLSEFGLNVARVREAHQADVERLEERQSSTDGTAGSSTLWDPSGSH